jgi:hypothetical protein
VAAVKTIDKKQLKVDEINKILTESITPTLDKLRSERSTFMRWAANNTEVGTAHTYQFDALYSRVSVWRFLFARICLTLFISAYMSDAL